MYPILQQVLCPKRSLEILTLLSREGDRNFSAIVDAIPTSSDVVSRRLDSLCEHDLVERHERSTRDVSYSVTAKGTEVLAQVDELETLLAD